MRTLLVSAILLVMPLVASAQKVTLPTEVRGSVGEWIVIPAEVEGGAPKWKLPPGLDEVNLAAIFSPDCLAKAKGKVVKASAPGRFTVLSWNAKGDVASDLATCTVIITGAPTTPPSPPTDPGQPLPPEEGTLYFMVVRPDGPAAPEYTRIMSMPEWQTLKDKKYLVGDFTLTEARKYLSIADNVRLPCVITFWDTGKKSTIVRQPIGLPATGGGVLSLPDGLTR